jgi:TorA maturation chaperone TorD
MGDCALHIQNIFQALSLRVPPDFQGTPDHLTLELELLSYLYRFASEDQIRQFIEDHLDWIPNLRDEIQKDDPGFYGKSVERLLEFLHKEIHSSKERQNESQSLH